MAYALQQPFKEELDRLQKKQIIVPLDVDKASEWCDSFIMVPNVNGKVQLWQDPVRLNKVLIRPVHWGTTLNDIWPRLVGVRYLTLIDASLGYDNLKPAEQSSCLTTFSYPFGRYRYIQLQFEVVSTGNMFQRI